MRQAGAGRLSTKHLPVAAYLSKLTGEPWAPRADAPGTPFTVGRGHGCCLISGRTRERRQQGP